jgi:hypothetical protein
LLDSAADVVAYRPDLLDGEFSRVGEVPVEVTLAGIDRAGAAAQGAGAIPA